MENVLKGWCKVEMKKEILIYEVGPRDGFQNIKDYIRAENKMEIIDSLIHSGVKHVQLTSFVSPKAIPQMKDAEMIASECADKYPQMDFMALVPNLRGAKRAWECKIRSVAYVVSLSASHNKANINRTHEESFRELAEIRNAYPEMQICLDLATAFGCPFEGKKETGEIVEFLQIYIDMGINEVNLCDTIGVANPRQVRDVIKEIKTVFPDISLQVHIHDTRNMGMVNTLAAIECGVDKVQSTLGGLGGCPFAPGATGNLATEDLVYMLEDMGYQTGIDVDKLWAAARREREIIPTGLFSGHLINIDTIRR